MPIRPLAPALASALALVTLTPVSQAHVQHAHVHGKAFADLAIDGERVEIQLRATAQDLVGFERAPASAAEEARVLDARKAMLDHARLWQFSVAARCTADAPTLEVAGATTLNGDDQRHKHDHGHDHDHDPSHGGGAQHVDWTARYTFRCAEPSALRAIDTGVFEHFPSLQTITVQVIDARGARGEALTPATPRITLQP